MKNIFKYAPNFGTMEYIAINEENEKITLSVSNKDGDKLTIDLSMTGISNLHIALLKYLLSKEKPVFE